MSLSPVNIWLRLGRILLVIYAVLILAGTVIGVFLFPAYAHAHAADYLPNNSWTVTQVQVGLTQLGWPATVPAYVDLFRFLLMLCVGIPTGLLLLQRRTANWFILYLAFVFISSGLSDVFFLPFQSVLPWTINLRQFFGAANWQFFFIALYFFPSGRAAPRWTRWVAFAWLGLIAVSQIFGEVRALNGTGIFFALPIGAILSQVYRYFWRSTFLERQQTKWVFSAVVFFLVFIALAGLWGFNPPSGPDYRASLVIALAILFVASVMFALFPVAVAVAILRYRLWDIDLIIRRTLQYGLLTILLGLVYFGMVVSLEGAFRALTGQDSPLAVVLSTLMIAALFTPLRRRIQNFIDRSFFRRSYNTEHILAGFADLARSETDIQALTVKMVEITTETIQPESISLWIRSGAKIWARSQSERNKPV